MKYFITIVVFALAACGHSPTHDDSTRRPAAYVKPSEIPVEDFFRNPSAFGFRISPNGQQIAVLKSWKSRLNVFVYPVEYPDRVKQITFVEKRDIRSVHWKGNSHLIFEQDTNGDENDHVFVVNVETSELKDLTPYAGTKAGLADDLAEVSDTDVLITHNQRNKELFDVYRVNILTGAIQMVAENKYNIESWLIDHTGAVRGGSASDGVNSVFYFEKTKGSGFKPIFKTGFRNNFSPFAFTADNKNLYAVSNLGRNLKAIIEIDPEKPIKPGAGKVIYSHPRYDVEDATYSEVRKSLGSVTLITDRREITFLHPQDQKDWTYLRSLFPKDSLALANESKDERFWVIRSLSDISRGAYYVYDRQERKLTSLGEVSPWIQPELMSEMKTVHFKSRDGLDIEGYLTLPRGHEGKKLSVVVNPHGGPWARDEWGFNPEVQFLASRGYAVFQLNFRGSTGYGRKFWEASFKQWGKNMQNDITDGVKWLIKKNYADPKKVCIYGGSYGGYATLAGVTFTPDLYACGVDYVGVSNLFTFMKTIPPYWKSFLDMMYVMVGNPEKDKVLLHSASPVFYVNQIKAPLFVAQGANDPRVNKAESDQIVEALRKRGVSVEYMVKDNEGHGFRNEENRFDFYRAMEKFFAKYL